VNAAASDRVPTAILVSGAGTNLQGVIDRVNANELPLDIRLVIASRAGAPAIERARAAGLPVSVMPYERERETRAQYAKRLAAEIARHGGQLVLLLGWMHVLSREFLKAGFAGVLNLHPSYLPENPAHNTVTLPDGSTCRVYRGAHALRDALDAGEQMAGASLIEITPEIDRGPLLARRPFELKPDDTLETALARLHPIEQEVVAEGIRVWLLRKPQAAVERSSRTRP
jgi:phosphoribosylglycinamide formyltransferase 1